LIFRDAEGGEYQPVQHYNRKTGKSAFRIKPPGASNETDDCIELDTIEELAKAMLVDKLPARVKALAGGPVNYLKFGAQKLVAYELDPAIADRLGVPAVSGGVYSQADRIRRFIVENYVSPARERNDSVIELVSGEVHNAMGLQDALPAVCSAIEGKALAKQAKVKLLDRQSPIGSDKPSSTIRYRFELQNIVTLDMVAFERLKKAFLARHPDFTSFAETPSFASNEGDYKQALVEEAQRLLVSMRDASDAELGEALIEMLAGRTKLFCNLIDWHAMSVIDKARKANPGLFEAAAGRAVRADNHDEAVVAFVGAIWTPLRGDPPINPYAESRMLSTMLRALVDPQSVLPIRSTPTDNASRMLCGQPAFANAPLSLGELTNVTGMAKEMMRVMDQEWGWAPRHLWDVQGFIWETSQKILRDSEMTDDELLYLFDSCEYFRTRRINWTNEQTASFCRMARQVHDLGLDWYRTNIPQIRFGRKENGAQRASATLASFDAAPARIRFSHSAVELGLADLRFNCDPEGERAFSELLEKNMDQIKTWQPPFPKRLGLWPSYDQGELVNEHASAKIALDDAQPTNLILYGPPGTGKTYRTASEAVRLCGEVVPKDRDDLMQRYEELTKEGRIRFVTFHQSFSYEEFVEGLRPETSLSESQDTEGTGFRLEPRPGIFRELCVVAGEALKTPIDTAARLDFGGRNFWKMGLGAIGYQDSVYEGCIAGDYVALGWGADVDWSDPRFANLDAIRAEWSSKPRENDQPSNVTQLHPFRNTMKIGDIVIVPSGNRAFRAVGEVVGDYYFEHDGEPTYYHRRKVRWLSVLNEPLPLDSIIDGDFQMRTFYSIASTRVNKDALSRLISPAGSGGEDPNNRSAPQQFVLIIDEINRANVSKVFGELITLIEPDKRLGMPNALKVRLPYSKREFGVPANLHIIGTMNTADRSIALLDTALRRRFRFEEMAPDTSVPAFREAELSTGLPLVLVLDTMNRRIEYLVDRDHRIGHAFFIGCKTKADVDAVMRDKVIPLLQEYFFDDWNRLAAVLGEKDKGGNFLDCEKIEDPMGEGRDPLKSWRVRKQFDEGAYDRLISAKPAPSTEPEGEV
jgi:hypothetical protein